jgi:putative molybdopterin biosynthesis protein
LAKKLLWAERQVVARNAMELVKVRTDIEQVFAQAMAPDAQILTLSGCPDESLLLLKDRTASLDLLLDVTFNSSRQGLEDLVAGRSLIAGFNAPANAGMQSAAVAAFADLCDFSQIALFHYCSRTQGLGVARGNPLKISSLIDVVRKKARYINREEGTGTRVLLEDLIAQSGLCSSSISGYDNIETSHQAVAQAILQGTADVGLCIESIAKKSGIDFIPLVVETYYLAVLKKNLCAPGLGKLLSVLQDDSWHRQCSSLAGYSAVLAGTPIEQSDAAWLHNR